MAYCNGNPYNEHSSPVTIIWCDQCAYRHLKFTRDRDGTKWQPKEWYWFPHYGSQCHACGKES